MGRGVGAEVSRRAPRAARVAVTAKAAGVAAWAGTACVSPPHAQAQSCQYEVEASLHFQGGDLKLMGLDPCTTFKSFYTEVVRNQPLANGTIYAAVGDWYDEQGCKVQAYGSEYACQTPVIRAPSGPTTLEALAEYCPRAGYYADGKPYLQYNGVANILSTNGPFQYYTTGSC